MLAGSIELLRPGQTLEYVESAMKQYVMSIKEAVVDSLDLEMAQNMILSLHFFVKMVVQKKQEGVDCELFKKHCAAILDFCFAALSAFQSFKLQRKEEPKHVTKSRKDCYQIIRWLSYLHDDVQPSEDESDLGCYFRASIDRVFEPFTKLASDARVWFVEEKARDKQRAQEEVEWKAEQRKQDEAEAVVRREQNKKEAAAQQQMGEMYLALEEKKQIREERKQRRAARAERRQKAIEAGEEPPVDTESDGEEEQVPDQFKEALTKLQEKEKQEKLAKEAGNDVDKENQKPADAKT